jgi:HD-like signal output (HDOD) protein
MSPAPALSDRPDAPDADYALALGVEPATLTAVAAEPTPEDTQTVEAVLAHFATVRPGLSSFPSIATQILELVRYPDVDLAELARYIRLDGALAGAVLALANSAVYRGVKTIETVKDAVARLGITEVARLAAAISMRSLYSPEIRSEFERFMPIWNKLFFHAVRTGRGASDLAKTKVFQTSGPEQMFLAGLLHDVGKSIAMRSMAALLMTAKVKPRDDAGITRILHLAHVPVGVELHRTWNLPASLMDVAALHHDAVVPAEPARGGVHLVRLVSALDLLRLEPETNLRAAAEILQSCRAGGLSPARLAEIGKQQLAAEEWAKRVFADKAA